MKAPVLGFGILMGTVLVCAPVAPGEKPATERSPVDLALLPGGRYALTANQGSDSVSLVDLDLGRLVAEAPCGRKPSAVACSPDGQLAAVSNLWSATVTLFEVRGSELRRLAEVGVGDFPSGLVFTLQGDQLIVAVSGTDEVIVIDWRQQQIVQRWPSPREPRHVALSSDGRWLTAASGRSGQVRCWNLQTRQLHWERRIEDAFNLRGLTFTSDGQAVICAHVVRREFPVSKENIEEGWVNDSRLTRLAISADATPAIQQIALDTRGRAVGDPHGLALGPGGLLALSGSGTHELLLMDSAAVPWNAGDPADFMDAGLANRCRRVDVGGRPLTIRLRDGTHQLVAANSLADAVQIVDTRQGKLLRSIALGGPARPTLARQGEALFYDARRSHHHWFSCHTCHVDGHTCGLTFDTLNDDSYGNPKLTPTLRNVTRTGPWTWHGWQKDLGAAVEKSFTQTMYGPPPTAAESRALLAFLATLEHPPRQRRPATDRTVDQGRELFVGKAGCARCHRGDEYHSTMNYDLPQERDGSPYQRWNPPSLRGLLDRGPYLHDGRARSLEDVLQKHHTPESLGGEALTPREQLSLIAFLKTL